VFDAKLAIFPLVTKVTSNERPEIPDIALPQLKEIIQACWHPDPTKRPTALQMAGFFAGAEWNLIWGAYRKPVKAFLAKLLPGASSRRRARSGRARATLLG
jgi:hypothetical protein